MLLAVRYVDLQTAFISDRHNGGEQVGGRIVAYGMRSSTMPAARSYQVHERKDVTASSTLGLIWRQQLQTAARCLQHLAQQQP